MLVLAFIVACSNSGDPTNSPGTAPPPEDVVITIGNLTDLTGVSASAMDKIDKALGDMVKHYNEENLIPGVKLDIETYDSQFDPSQSIPGYEYLKDRGADLIWAPCPPTALILKPIVNRDEIPMFVASSNIDTIMPPQYTFSLGLMSQYEAYTLLKWIAENDWDYKTNGPAKIGGAAWAEDMSDVQFKAMKEYADAHPEQFEWKGGHLTDFGFDWTIQVEALKDCDYIYPPVPMHAFVREYSRSGSKAKLIGIDPHAGFLDMIDKADYWDEIDGMIFIRGSRWWTEEGKLIDLTRELLYKNHPDEAEDIIRSGVGYLGAAQTYHICNIIKNAAAKVGPENVDSQAIYEAAISYSEAIDGVERYSFDDTKRFAINYYVIYEVDGEKRDLFRADEDWIPAVTEP